VGRVAIEHLPSYGSNKQGQRGFVESRRASARSVLQGMPHESTAVRLPGDQNPETAELAEIALSALATFCC
jgi:hypothetical protein